jgi:uncharacterized protein (DUF697 family)
MVGVIVMEGVLRVVGILIMAGALIMARVARTLGHAAGKHACIMEVFSSGRHARRVSL